MSESSSVRLYEGLFLLEQEAAANDFGGSIDFIRNVFERAGAELLVLRKWEERRLAYEIRGQRRGIYLLAYFKVDGRQLVGIERDCELSDYILRSMIIRADHVGDVELEVAAKDADLSLEATSRDEPAEPRVRAAPPEPAAPSEPAVDKADDAPAPDAGEEKAADEAPVATEDKAPAEST